MGENENENENEKSLRMERSHHTENESPVC